MKYLSAMTMGLIIIVDGGETFAWDNFNRTFKCFLASGDTPADPGSRISFEIREIINSDVSGNYTVTVSVSDSNEVLTHGPGLSDQFLLSPGQLVLIMDN